MFASNPGTYYLELQSSRNYTVGDSYFDYLATSLNYRSDLVRIVARLQQFFSFLTQKKNKSWRSNKKWLPTSVLEQFQLDLGSWNAMLQYCVQKIFIDEIKKHDL